MDILQWKVRFHFSVYQEIEFISFASPMTETVPGTQFVAQKIMLNWLNHDLNNLYFKKSKLDNKKVFGVNVLLREQHMILPG